MRNSKATIKCVYLYGVCRVLLIFINDGLTAAFVLALKAYKWGMFSRSWTYAMQVPQLSKTSLTKTARLGAIG